MTLAKKFQKLFGKSIDEAVKEKEEKESKDAEKEEKEEKEKESKDEKDEKEKKDAKDAEKEEKEKKEKESKDDDDKEKEDKSKDESPEEQQKEDESMKSLSERLAKLEAAITSIMDKMGGESEEVEAEDDYEVEDEKEEKEESAADEDDKEDEKKGKAGDTMRRAEILAPGIKSGSDVKGRALAVAYKSKDGKKIIDTLLAGKTLKDTKNLEAVFVAASELLKSARVNDFASARAITIDNFPALKQTGEMTADKINEINAAMYGKKEK